jgi:hypothetical protein
MKEKSRIAPDRFDPHQFAAAAACDDVRCHHNDA